MSTMFPAMISNEPPPLDSGDEDDSEDYIEFRSGGLNLDVLADPSPMSSPLKVQSRNEFKDKDTPQTSSSDSTTSGDSPLRVPVISHQNASTSEENLVENEPIETETLSIIASIDDAKDVSQTTVSNKDRHGSDSQEAFIEAYHCENQADRDPDLHSTRLADACVKTSITSIANPSPLSELEQVNILESSISSINDKSVIEVTEEIDLKTRATNTDVETLTSSSAVNMEPNLTITVHDENDDDSQSFSQCQYQSCNTAAQILIPEPFVTAKDVQDEGIDEAVSVRCNALLDPATLGDCEASDSVHDDWRPFEDCGPNDVPETNDFDDDDFGDFASSEINAPATSELPQVSSAPPSVNTVVEESLDVIIKSLFAHGDPIRSTGVPFKSIDTELKSEASNKTWTHVQEFEDSYGLVFKWANSRIYQHLLRSLNVDPSTVLYSRKWGTIEVPKFAASLVDTPLQPQASFKPSQAYIEDFLQDPPEYNSPASSSQSPGAESSNSGTVDMEEEKLDPKYSKETIKILEQLPDLSYMRAKTLVFPREPRY